MCVPQDWYYSTTMVVLLLPYSSPLEALWQSSVSPLVVFWLLVASYMTSHLFSQSSNVFTPGLNGRGGGRKKLTQLTKVNNCC